MFTDNVLKFAHRERQVNSPETGRPCTGQDQSVDTVDIARVALQHINGFGG